MMGKLLDKSLQENLAKSVPENPVKSAPGTRVCTKHCKGLGPETALGVSLLAGFQSLLTIGLTFLSALALLD
jgi:hypothetical protein